MKNIYQILTASLFMLCSLSVMAQNNRTGGQLFLNESEYKLLKDMDKTSQTAELFQAMKLRVERRALTPNLTDPSATTEWWHHISEYLTDAALVYALSPSDKVGTWLRSNVLGVVRRPVADWAGPRFRGYGGGDMVGGLETAHLTWSVAISLDMAPSLFTPSEKEEIKTALREKGMLPCRRYLVQSNFFHNWNCILFAGMSVAAAVLEDAEYLQYAKDYLPVALDHFQPDGSYGESLQYANYAAYGIMLGHEALLRSGYINETTFNPYGRLVDWASYAHFYRKPLSRWPLSDLSRSANFGDCASIFRPSGDVLIHISARAKNELPVQAGVARWLFDSLYFPANELGPHDLASFGMINDFGFLSVVMLGNAAQPVSPVQAGYSELKTFSGGDAFLRDSWGGKTILAARIPAEPRHASAHLHGDVNSFILVHNGERLLVDPGHTCYRNITRALDVSATGHNTCTFEVPQTASDPARTLDQRGGINRPMKTVNGKKTGEAPISIGGKRLLEAHKGKLSVLASDAADLYGAPLQSYARFILLCGSNALFVVDCIEASEPLRTTWNWLLNNRDGNLDYQFSRPSRFSAIRGNAGIRITNYAPKKSLEGPNYALVHDAYHVLPNQFSEGTPGTGIMMRFKETVPQAKRLVVHTLAIDTSAALDSWNSKQEGNIYTLESKDRGEKWVLQVAEDGSLTVNETNTKQNYKIAQDKNRKWYLK